jgi:hypothetical protein
MIGNFQGTFGAFVIARLRATVDPEEFSELTMLASFMEICE